MPTSLENRNPRYSVIVPAYNEEKRISACLSALASQTVPSSSYEVIVVDDGSTDRTAAIAASLGAKVIRQSNSGSGAARNAGLSVALGDIVLFTDADCAPERDWVEEMGRALAEAQADGVKGSFATLQTSTVARFVQAEWEEKEDLLCNHEGTDFVDTGCAAYRRSVLEQAGGFVPNSPVDDVELSFRLARAGRKLVFHKAAKVYHSHPETVRAYAWRKFRKGMGRAMFLFAGLPRHAFTDTRIPASFQAQIALAPVVLLALPLSLAWWPAGLAAIVALLAFYVTALPLIFRAFQKGVHVGIAAIPMVMIRALATGVGFAAGVIMGAGRATGPRPDRS